MKSDWLTVEVMIDPESFLKVPIDLQKIEKSEVVKDSEFQKALDFLEQINAIAEQARDITEKFNQIPVVSE